MSKPSHGPPGERGMPATSSPTSRRSLLTAAAAGCAVGMLAAPLRAASEDRENERPTKTTSHAGDEAQIRRLVARSAEAIRAQDLEGLRTLYAPDILSFDVGQDMQTVGVAAKMQNWVTAFTLFQPPIGYEIRELTVTVSHDMAYTHSINRLSGTLKNGKANMTGPWVRNTNVYRKIGDTWLLAHDHVSVPINPQTGQAMMSLKP